MTRRHKLAFAFVIATILAAGCALLAPNRAEAQADPWKALGGMNGVELYSCRDGSVTCYVASTGGVSCVKR